MKIIKRVLQWFKNLFRGSTKSEYIPQRKGISYRAYMNYKFKKYSGVRRYTKAPAIQ